MADNSSEQPQSRPKGFSNLVRHMTTDYLGVGLWLTRIITIILALFGYILPLLGGFFGDPVACCKLLFYYCFQVSTHISIISLIDYKTLMAAAATSALRLHQRMPRIQLNQEFITTSNIFINRQKIVSRLSKFSLSFSRYGRFCSLSNFLPHLFIRLIAHYNCNTPSLFIRYPSLGKLLADVIGCFGRTVQCLGNKVSHLRRRASIPEHLANDRIY